MNTLLQQMTRNGQIFPSPQMHQRVEENPPVFCWRKEGGAGAYTVVVRDANENIFWQTETRDNYAVPGISFPGGSYSWNLYAGNASRGWVHFTVADDAACIQRKSAQEVLTLVPAVRPRHLFFAQDVPQIVQENASALQTLRRNIALALSDGLPEPPAYHWDANALPYREYFGRHRDYCDRNLVACALGHALLDDTNAAEHARKLLLCLCTWNPDGPCSLEGPWGDEVGLSHARCLPAVFDLCYDLLTGKERTFVARTIAAYAGQCERLLQRIDFCENPGNSHAGRLPAYLGEAALVLKGTGVVAEENLLRWLNTALSIYGGIFPYFGGADGGWAEGMFYASSYTKWFLPFFSAVQRFAGVDFLSRPFYRHYCTYLQHFCAPGMELHPFGDGYWCYPEDAEWPGFFAQNPYRLYAERFGSTLLREWSQNAQAQDVFRLHLLDVFLPDGNLPAEQQPVTRAQAFSDTGLVSLHTNPEQPKEDIALLARASRFGSVSHSHADQGSFALFCGGTALIAPSGYFGRQYGTVHHLHWTNTTRAHNTLLVDGKGQEEFSFRATGSVLYAKDEGHSLTAAIDPSAAYPEMEHWQRTFTLCEDYLLVRDHVRLHEPGVLTYCLHALSRPEIAGNQAGIFRNGVTLTITPEEGDLASLTLADTFAVDLNEGEPEAYHVQMPPQYHLSYTTPKRREHILVVRYTIAKPQ